MKYLFRHKNLKVVEKHLLSAVSKYYLWSAFVLLKIQMNPLNWRQFWSLQGKLKMNALKEFLIIKQSRVQRKGILKRIRKP